MKHTSGFPPIGGSLNCSADMSNVATVERNTPVLEVRAEENNPIRVNEH